MTQATTHVFQVYIKASPEKIWTAITDPAWNQRYGYGAPSFYELKAGGAYKAEPSAEMQQHAPGMPNPMIDGEVIEADPPHKLVQTYRFLFSPDNEKEGFTKLTWEIKDTGAGFSQLTVTHNVEGAPMMARAIKSDFSFDGGGGWAFILNDLKTLLETGTSLGKAA